MKSTHSLAVESFPIGDPSNVETTTRSGVVFTGEFYAGRALPLPNSHAVSDVISKYELDPSRRAAMQSARKAMASHLHSTRPTGLASLRMRCGLSQTLLAEAIGSSQPHIAKIEAGKNDPGTSLIVRIANALGATPAQVLDAILVDQAATVSSQ